MAKALLRAGLPQEACVGVSLPRGFHQLVAVIGILRAGGVYVPIDGEAPPERKESMLRSADVWCVLGGGEEADGQDVRFQRVRLGEALLDSEPEAGVPFPTINPDLPAYVIFTSGSTGVPKGVVVTHRAALNTIEDVNLRFRITDGDVGLALAALSFDLSVYDVFGLLGVGATLLMLD